MAWFSSAGAETPLMNLSNRAGGFEVLLQSNYIDSKSFEGQNGSSADVQDSWGWGFGFGYNFSENWAFNFDIGWRSANFDATLIVEDQDDPANSGPKRYAGRLDTSSSLFSATYNFMDRRFTPFVSGTLGWTFIDTNIPTGPPQNWCWWDPWLGYICSSYVPTRSETDFTYGGGLGVRFDVTRTMFLRASYNKLWIDFKNASAEDFDTIRLDIGFLMN
jgi:opacity protein-like surface antigen